ncbi:transglutaminase family protein [Desulfurobacterium sp.]
MKVKSLVFILSLFSAVVGAALLIPFVSPIVSGFFFCSVAFSVWREIKGLKGDVVNRWILNVVALAGTFFLLSDLKPDNLVIPVASTLMFLLGIKFIEEKKTRDFYQIVALSLFLFAAASVLTFSIKFLLLFVLEAFFVIASAVLLSFLSEDAAVVLPWRSVRYVFVFSALFFLISLPLTLLFFFFLPRTETPVINLGTPSSVGVSGFSTSVSPGDVSSIQQVDAVFMRVKSRRLPFEPYFRAITYEKVVNGRWIHVLTESKRKRIVVKGRTVRETVILEPYGYESLPLIDVPLRIDFSGARRENGCFFANKPVMRRIRYSGLSVLTDSVQEFLSEKEREIYLALPEMPKVERFVIKTFGKVKKERLPDALLAFFKNFQYSLKKLPPSVEDFILKSHRGSCEYFAGAAAVIFRLKGVPARLVGGFYGGEYNPYGGYYIVRDKNAHVWVEYYLNGRWHRFDPTLAASFSGRGGADGVRAVRRGDFRFDRLKLLLDTVNYYWINFVINYDFSMQVRFALALGKRTPEVPRFFNYDFVSFDKKIFIYVLSLVLIFVIFILFLKTRKTIIDEFYEVMRKKGYVRRKNEPLEMFVKRIENPALRQKAEEFVRIYEDSFYKDKPVCCITLDKLRTIIRQLKENDSH